MMLQPPSKEWVARRRSFTATQRRASMGPCSAAYSAYAHKLAPQGNCRRPSGTGRGGLISAPLLDIVSVFRGVARCGRSPYNASTASPAWIALQLVGHFHNAHREVGAADRAYGEEYPKGHPAGHVRGLRTGFTHSMSHTTAMDPKKAQLRTVKAHSAPVIRAPLSLRFR